MRASPLLISLFFLCFLAAVVPVAAQECSATKKCATGCCSQFGFCGTDEAHCGDGCLSTCDYKLGCDAKSPCADGTCCSKYGFCGFGKDFCAPENCVAGCNATAQCDPGTFGADYVQLQKCPLNVCCSKFGYCGSTAEFCGSKSVRRPSCAVNSDTSMKRVVGYYEGWAARRVCQAYMPENVPLGVYTHLNFAFAGIDPTTYHIVPAQDEDVALYTRLTDLKKSDSALKVFIAIGGWTFNDPGATFRTFSELAADETKQKAFFVSLISFLNTYNFDGVDIDWEYPVDEDRGGAKADFANYPRFMKNLKAALNAGSGGRNGLSVTVPVSFWYLQNFDIVELAKWVDYFNVMSYDLHGLWDKGNKWLGPFLNSHTNMTEITQYLDLFWRNDISPSKVTLGLAFYSRTFMAADAGCTTAQCTFDTVGEAGPCSRDSIGGTLTNAELTDQIRKAGVTPTLDKDAMVKVAVIGRKWITYDDEDTFKLKTDAARKLCLGGVMVWAVSQDYAYKSDSVAAAVGKRASGLFDAQYSLQLQVATKYKSLKAVTVERDTSSVADEPTPNIVRNQCFWSNCGEGCGRDNMAVPRLDTDSHKNEVMQDSYNCQGGTLRQFCCPRSKAIPKCGWFDFFNGKCGKHGACPAGSEKIVAASAQQREIGSTQVACNNGKAQVACCQTEDDDGAALDSMRGYDMCKWFGTATDSCDAAGAVTDPDQGRDMACKLKDSDRPDYLLETYWGSGATHCRDKAYSKKDDQYRPLCCKFAETNVQWRSCGIVFAEHKDGNFCQAYCPAGTIRLAMEKPEVYHNCKGGGHAICCEPRFLTEANNADEVHHGYVLALENVLNSPGMCDWSEVNNVNTNGALAARKRQVLSADCKVALLGTANMLGSPDIGIQQKYVNDWNLAVNQVSMYNVPASAMQKFPDGLAYSTAPSAALQTDTVQIVLDNAKEVNTRTKTVPKYTWRCPPEWVWDSSLDDVTDPDDGGSETVDPDFNSVRIQLRGTRDVQNTAGDASANTSGSGRRSVPGSASHTHPSPSNEDWDENLRRLNSFRLDNNKKGFNKFTRVTGPSLDDLDDETCQQTMRCRAHRMGFDTTTQQGRLAFINATSSSVRAGPRRYEDVLEERRQRAAGTLVARDTLQMGQPRAYTVLSGRYSSSQWPGEIIESSSYPNGNQGDDLASINEDSSRYVVKSTGCGPTGYTLVTQATKRAANGIWVSEHILELNTIGRFITASLDGGLGGLGPPSNLPAFAFSRPANLDEARHFTYMFAAWKEYTAITPADTCLLKLGSIQASFGMVVCDSTLNLLKTNIYKLKNPVGEIKWNTWCIAPTPESLERALAYIQGVMAVFDYYDDGNVKTRHAQAYEAVLNEMSEFELAYQRQTSLNIYGQWQDRWHVFMKAQFLRVLTNTRIWLQNKIDELIVIWNWQLLQCVQSGVVECVYDLQALYLLAEHKSAVDGGKIDFDMDVFQTARVQ